MRVGVVVVVAVVLSGCVSKADQASEITAQADALCTGNGVARGSRDYQACRLEMTGKLLDVRGREARRRSDDAGDAALLLGGGLYAPRQQPRGSVTCTTDTSLGYAITNCR
jgi:hypothetical protein